MRRSTSPLRRALLPTLLAFAAALLLACGDGDVAVSTATSTPSSTSSPASTSTAAPVEALGDVDFAASPYLDDLLTQAGGGEVPPERVQIEDLTGDGSEEAVVVVESGGTLGDIGVAIYRLEEQRPALAFFRQLTGRVEVRLGLVVIQQGVYSPGDAECCPSQLRETAIGWEDGEFVVVSEQVVDAPD